LVLQYAGLPLGGGGWTAGGGFDVVFGVAVVAALFSLATGLAEALGVAGLTGVVRFGECLRFVLEAASAALAAVATLSTASADGSGVPLGFATTGAVVLFGLASRAACADASVEPLGVALMVPIPAAVSLVGGVIDVIA
jgi:hypothetical protein